MYRRQMLDHIGLFDEDFFAYADDAELGLRARIAGWKCLYMPGAVVRHHRGATSGPALDRAGWNLSSATAFCWRPSCFPGACFG